MLLLEEELSIEIRDVDGVQIHLKVEREVQKSQPRLNPHFHPGVPPTTTRS